MRPLSCNAWTKCSGPRATGWSGRSRRSRRRRSRSPASESGTISPGAASSMSTTSRPQPKRAAGDTAGRSSTGSPGDKARMRPAAPRFGSRLRARRGAPPLPQFGSTDQRASLRARHRLIQIGPVQEEKLVAHLCVFTLPFSAPPFEDGEGETVSDRESRPPSGRFNRPERSSGDASPRRRWRVAAAPGDFKPGGPRIRRYRLAAFVSREEQPAASPTQ
jgi:hypothetical protein